jgi:3-isopropylmalate/(R)-2-methylmalate dehydratase small subunit
VVGSVEVPFHSGAINDGLPVVELASGTVMIAKDDTVGIDFEKGVVIHNGKEYRFPALPKEVLAILNDGGLIPDVKKALAAAKP